MADDDYLKRVFQKFGTILSFRKADQKGLDTDSKTKEDFFPCSNLDSGT